MLALESVLACVSFFEPLRPDEIGRIARRFSLERLAPGDRCEIATDEGGKLAVVVEGRALLEVQSAAGVMRARLEPGDRYGEVALLTGHARRASLVAEEDAAVGLVDKAAFEAILAEFPAVAGPLARELASELAARNDVLRQLLELYAEGLSPDELAAAIEDRRRAVARRGARVRRLTPRALFHRLVVERGAEPPFWMLVGFLLSLGGARLVVALILKYGLEKRLFALVPGNDPNPMHVHHFNYGLVLIGMAGLAGLFPFGRRALRVLAFVFGLGAGLVFDEFALFWNLNPEYAQSLSLMAAAVMAALLVQLTYFRRFWLAVAGRWWSALGRTR